MNNYRLGVDCWEAETNIDYAALKANQVDFIIIRINDMNGGHHMDSNFLAQWQAAGQAGMIRAPYFVYNPWVNGRANYDWLIAHMPTGYVGRVFVDIEVRYTGITPSQYADQVQIFMDLLLLDYYASIYTGQWFVPNLAHWPAASYWWAQYPYALYPPTSIVTTWEWVRTILVAMSQEPTNKATCPGVIKLWQISGDRLILPGSSRPIDVNTFTGTYAELASWMGAEVVLPPALGKVVTSVVNIDGPIPELIVVNFADGTSQTIDQRITTPPPPATDPAIKRVASERWPITHAPLRIPPAGGPFTTTLSKTPKPAYFETPLAAGWVNYIASFNTPATMAKICDPGFGPSKGFNDNGKLRYIGLAWPGNAAAGNVVKILEIVGAMARIASIPMSAIPAGYSPSTHPWLFHRVCDNMGNPVMVQGHAIICPLLGDSLWIPLEALA